MADPGCGGRHPRNWKGSDRQRDGAITLKRRTARYRAIRATDSSSLVLKISRITAASSKTEGERRALPFAILYPLLGPWPNAQNLWELVGFVGVCRKYFRFGIYVYSSARRDHSVGGTRARLPAEFVMT